MGKHRIYGISDEFIPDILKLSELNEVVSVDDGDAIAMAQMRRGRWGWEWAFPPGRISSVRIGAEYDRCGQTLVTVFADDNKKYLSSDYAKEQKPEDSWLTKDIDPISVKGIR